MPTSEPITSLRACFECDQPSEVDHHVVPTVRGGTKTVPLCGRCHAKAHHRDGNMSNRKLTREALAANRARGERTGGPLPYGKQLADDRKTLIPRDDELCVLSLIKRFRNAGATLTAIADHLNGRGMLMRGGGQWHYQYVQRLCRQHGIRVEQPAVPWWRNVKPEVLSLVTRFRSGGATIEAITDHLNGRGILLRGSGQWTCRSVARLCKEHGIKCDHPIARKRCNDSGRPSFTGL
jgi:5-methylcytosine-specific restriction endonuclease McrA